MTKDEEIRSLLYRNLVLQWRIEQLVKTIAEAEAAKWMLDAAYAEIGSAMNCFPSIHRAKAYATYEGPPLDDFELREMERWVADRMKAHSARGKP